MKKWYILFPLISVIFKGGYGFSQNIQLPDETITGETLRIEKSSIFIRPAPAFMVVFPEIAMPEEELPEAKVAAWSPEGQEEQPSGRSYLSMSAGTYDLIRASLFYRHRDEYDKEHSVFLSNSFTEGHRKNAEEQKSSFALHWSKPASGEFSLELKNSDIGLPGRDSSPLDIERDSFSFSTNYSYLGKPEFVPSFSQSFYNIDGVEANFLLLNLQFNKDSLILGTTLERLDVFDDFSTMSFYQGLLIEKGQLTLGGGLKVIERYGERFLPVLRYSVNGNFYIGLESLYQIPDFCRDVMFANYKELTDYDLAPEEQYKFNAAFSKKTENTAFNIDVSQTYRENFYTWADADSNDLLEPSPEQCWQTSVSINLKQRLFRYLSFFFTGEKNFLSEKIDFYPEDKFDAGITFFSSSIYCKLWLSYTGERIFSGVETGSDAILNAELKMLHSENTEWGIGVYNLADREYFIIPGYPAEKRRFVSYLKLYF